MIWLKGHLAAIGSAVVVDVRVVVVLIVVAEVMVVAGAKVVLIDCKSSSVVDSTSFNVVCKDDCVVVDSVTTVVRSVWLMVVSLVVVTGSWVVIGSRLDRNVVVGGSVVVVDIVEAVVALSSAGTTEAK